MRIPVGAALIALLAACATANPESQPACEIAVAHDSAADPVLEVLEFASRIRGASPEQMHDERLQLERDVDTGTPGTSLLRLSLLLHELRAPGTDLGRAPRLLVRSLGDSAIPPHESVRSLAALLLRNWSENAALRRALHDADKQARRSRDALAEERQRRRRAEQQLDALINVERRARREGEPGIEVSAMPP